MISDRLIRLSAPLLVLFTAACSQPPAAPEATGQAAASEQGPSADSRVRLDAAAQARIGLEIKHIDVTTLREEIKAYGQLQEDPAQSFLVRAPVSGVLHAPSLRSWPALGAQLDAGEIVGHIEPRYPPTDRINLTDRLLTARAEARSATASVKVAEAAHERARILNADNKNVSDRALQEAAARLEAEQARLEAANDVLTVVESSLGAVDSARFLPLAVDRNGEVTEVLALPGEDVAVGSPLVRVVNFDHLLANIALPVGENVPPSARSARIVPSGRENVSIPATLVAVNASVDPAIQGQALLFRLSPGRQQLRPGQAVTAYVSIPGASSRVIVVPDSAVVRQAGESFAYVRESEDEFSRKRLQGLRPTAGGYVVENGLSAGDEVVVAGAQLLLSEELKSQISAGDDE